MHLVFIQVQCVQIYIYDIIMSRGLMFTANPQNHKCAHWLIAFLFDHSSTVKLIWDKMSSDISLLLRAALLTGTDV